MPARNVVRRPMMSPVRAPSSSRPPNASAYALITQDRLAVLNPSALRMSGSATLTIVASRISMSWATRITARTSRRRVGRAGLRTGALIDMRAPQR